MVVPTADSPLGCVQRLRSSSEICSIRCVKGARSLLLVATHQHVGGLWTDSSLLTYNICTMVTRQCWHKNCTSLLDLLTYVQLTLSLHTECACIIASVMKAVMRCMSPVRNRLRVVLSWPARPLAPVRKLCNGYRSSPVSPQAHLKLWLAELCDLQTHRICKPCIRNIAVTLTWPLRQRTI